MKLAVCFIILLCFFFFSCNIQIVLVSSHKDAHHHPVYPTPPYKLSKKYPNVHCFPDPSLISINGVVIGVTSSDPLFHIGREEIRWALLFF